jgi:hypothetical protein
MLGSRTTELCSLLFQFREGFLPLVICGIVEILD